MQSTNQIFISGMLNVCKGVHTIWDKLCLKSLTRLYKSWEVADLVVTIQDNSVHRVRGQENIFGEYCFFPNLITQNSWSCQAVRTIFFLRHYSTACILDISCTQQCVVKNVPNFLGGSNKLGNNPPDSSRLWGQFHLLGGCKTTLIRLWLILRLNFSPASVKLLIEALHLAHCIR